MRVASCLSLFLALGALPAAAQPQSPFQPPAQPVVMKEIQTQSVWQPGVVGRRWFLGGEAGGVSHTFFPAYTAVDGESLGSFRNAATGGQFDLLIGYEGGSHGPFAMALVGRFGVSLASWKLDVIDTPEFLGGTAEVPSSFAYKIPYTATIALQPRLPIGSRMCLLGELGGGLGRVEQIKTSRGGSTYDIANWRPFWDVGAGISVRVGRDARIYFMYRSANYAGYAFESRTPAGARFETIHDAPRTVAIVAGLTIPFGR
jgi:hypothetical protein